MSLSFVQQGSRISLQASSRFFIFRCCSWLLSLRQLWHSCFGPRDFAVTLSMLLWSFLSYGCCWRHLAKVLSCVSVTPLICKNTSFFFFLWSSDYLFSILQWVKKQETLPWCAALTSSVCSCFTPANLSPLTHVKLCSTFTSYGK